MAKVKKGQFRFKKHETVGASDAEDDQQFLKDCFVDFGDLSVLQDTENNKCIVIGRTGSGKTALLLRLSEVEDNCVWIKPENLSFNYLSNTSILKNLNEAGVHLDLFYRLLWKHVFAVELIRMRFHINTEKDQKGFLEQIRSLFGRNKQKEKALEYLVKWGESFWENTEVRIKEITEKLESDLKSNLGADFKYISGSVGEDTSVSTEKRYEIINKAQSVVNSIQISELNKVLDVLGEEYFNKPQPRFFILIDKLDENWVDDQVRYKLIKGLIEVVREFSRMGSTKIVMALRKDLLDRIIRLTRDAGFQEEKIRSFFLEIKWNQEQLIKLLERRINKLVSRQYSREQVSFFDIMPKEISGIDARKYFVDRTMYRPRDILEFFNCCIEEAVERPTLTETLVKNAEGKYSQLRYRSLGDEWFADYPGLLEFSKILKGARRVIALGEITDKDVQDLCLNIATKGECRGDLLFSRALDIAEGRVDNSSEFFKYLIILFYKVGLVGLKVDPTSSITWSFLDGAPINPHELSAGAKIHINPIFYRVLGVNPNS